MASLGYKLPEGIVIYHKAAKMYFKKTILKDNEWKGKYEDSNNRTAEH